MAKARLPLAVAPGGLCTSWHRQGYTFDGCMHNLAGSAPESVFHGMWRELAFATSEAGAAERPPLTDHASAMRS